MLCLIDHIDQKWHRGCPFAARLVVLGKCPQENRLRGNTQSGGAEGGGGLDRFHLTPTRLEQSLATGASRRITAAGRPVGDPFPFQAHAANPKVVTDSHPKPQRVGVEEHIPIGGQVNGDHRRRLIGAGGNRE